MASRISSLLPLRPLMAREIGKRWASTGSAHHATAASEGYHGNVWRNTLLVVIGGLVWYRVDKYLTANGEKHPLTKYIEYHMPSEEETKRRNDKHLALAKQAAEDKLLVQEAKRPPIVRLRYPEAFERHSPHCYELGNGVDLSELNVKYDYK
ncbi:uncharacterized protein VTP21DRAFT_8171 [Calcarisporiella thermophila]|uniref:uncharacterized protein n=1 Tax=Calcarisporiella thermophila TaxID=911321 RepID=UPI0037435815